MIYKLEIMIKYTTLAMIMMCLANHSKAQDKTYPKISNTATLSAIDTLHGYIIEDPYRRLEDLTDTQVEEWYQAQQTYTEQELSKLSQQSILYKQHKAIYSLSKTDVSFIFPHQESVFYKKASPEHNGEKIMLRDAKGIEETLFSTASYPDSLKASINFLRPSPDGKHVVFGISYQNTEVADLHIIEVDSKTLLDEKIPRNLLSLPEWANNGKGFFYHQLQDTQNPREKWFYSASKYHELNTPYQDDQEIFSYQVIDTLQAIDWPIVYTFKNTDFVLGTVHHGIEPYPTIYVNTSEEGQVEAQGWKLLFDQEDKIGAYVVYDNSLFALQYTNNENGKLVRFILDETGNIINELIINTSQPKIIFENIIRNNDGLYLLSSKYGVDQITRFDLETLEKNTLDLQIQGSVELSNWMYTIKSKMSDKLYFSLESWSDEKAIHCYDHSRQTTYKTDLIEEIEFDGASDISAFITEVEGHDGEMIPMTIIHHKNADLTTPKQAVLDGYGAYGYSIEPGFDAHLIPWLKKGGIVAKAHIRGGGIKGPKWHEAGKLEKKSNGWKDYVSCVEYLIDNNYTDKSKLVAMSGSAGTVSVGKAVIERPDLFSVAILKVGLMNPLRHEFTPNNTNAAEFGTVKDSVQMLAMLETDPYMSIKPDKQYPAMLLTAGTNDPRVTLWQPGKMVARLQDSDTQKLVLMRISDGGGHFASGDESLREKAAIYAFIYEQLDVKLESSTKTIE